jgi:pimeloyl-ACP methyl ester carboxylesterase
MLDCRGGERVNSAAGLAHTRAGEGQPLLLIHGLGADRHCWAPVLETLAERFEVIAVDLPGFGQTPRLARGDAPRPERLAGIVSEFLTRVGIDGPVHVAGSSLGAWIALEMAAQSQTLSVTGICPAGLWHTPLLGEHSRPTPTGRTLLRLARPLLLAAADYPLGRRALLSMIVDGAARLDPQDARGLLDAWLCAPGYQETNLWMRRGAFDSWEAVRVPVTLAWGRRDHLVKPPRNLPSGVLSVTLPGCSHLAMWDAPELVANTITDTATAKSPTASPSRAPSSSAAAVRAAAQRSTGSTSRPHGC